MSVECQRLLSVILHQLERRHMNKSIHDYCDILWLRVVSSFLLQMCLFYQNYSGQIFSHDQTTKLCIYIYMYIHIYILDIMTCCEYIYIYIHVYIYIYIDMRLKCSRGYSFRLGVFSKYIHPRRLWVPWCARIPRRWHSWDAPRRHAVIMKRQRLGKWQWIWEGMKYGYDIQSIYCSSYVFCIYIYV